MKFALRIWFEPWEFANHYFGLAGFLNEIEILEQGFTVAENTEGMSHLTLFFVTI